MKVAADKRFVALDQQGMTLLEIMVTLLILGTVVSMVSISLSGSVNVLNATMDHGEIYHRAHVALQRISEDLSSAVLIDGEDFIGTDEQVGGQDGNSLQFTSTAHVVFDPDNDNPGMAVISYRVQEDSQNEGELLLVRSDELLVAAMQRAGAGSDPEGFLLCDGLRSVTFRYIDETGEESDDWTTVQDAFSNTTAPKLPVAVRVTLEFWVDQENDASIAFDTSVFLPVGWINAPI